MEPGGRYRRVFHKTVQRAGDVEESWHELGRLTESHAGGLWNILQLIVQQRKDDWLGGQSGHEKNVGKMQNLLQISLHKAEAIRQSDRQKVWLRKCRKCEREAHHLRRQHLWHVRGIKKYVVGGSLTDTENGNNQWSHGWIVPAAHRDEPGAGQENFEINCTYQNAY